MQVIGFNLTKIYGEKLDNFSKPDINNNIEFIDVEKQKVELLKDLEAIKIVFKYSLLYNSSESEKSKTKEKQGEVAFEGNIILSVNEEESKEFHKMWKKKQIPISAMTSLYSFILKRCSLKALNIQDDLNLPSPYFKLPSIKLKPQE